MVRKGSVQSLENNNLLTIIYDFDGTITKPNLPKYLIIDECGYENGTQGKKFLDEVKGIEKETNGEVAEIYISVASGEALFKNIWINFKLR